MKKNIVIIILFLTIIGVGIFYFVSNKDSDSNKENSEIEEKKSDYYIIYGIDTRWYFDGSNWNFIKEENINEVEWITFDVFDNNEFIGEYYLQFNKRWYVFNEDLISQKYNGPIFAYKGQDELVIKTDVKDFEIVDFQELDGLLTTLNIKPYKELVYSKKINLISNNENVTIYVANNVFSENEEENVFSLVYIKQNGEIKVIEKYYGNIDEQYTMPIYYFTNVFTIGNPNVYKFMILKTYYGNSSNDCNLLYEIDNSSSKKLIDCDKIYSEEIKFEEQEEKEEEKNPVLQILIYFGIGILTIVLVLIVYIFIKNRRENKV